jgi:anaerobic magnesium-protoporphyrin IX monomethyl ester cyclase
MFPWPLEPKCGWGPGPVASIITSRVCPWQCSFCSEASFIPSMGRRSVDQVIDELNYLDRKHGPLGSVVIHDSMFFQNPPYLREWLEKYPRKTRKPWPYWAAGRADTVRQWPDLFEALVRETNWTAVSIGFESGSDRVLKILNKECTAEDNYFTIELLDKIGDDLERKGKPAPKFWSNIMFGIPGETREDAFETMAMLRSMKRVMPSIAYYAPYPGSALGYQLIAEGKSLMTKENYHRNPSDRKVKGVDYDFYDKLRKGGFESEVRDKIFTHVNNKRLKQFNLVKA